MDQIHDNATEDVDTGDRIYPDAEQPSVWSNADRQRPERFCEVRRIVRHHGDGTEEVVFDSRVSGTDLPTATG